MTHKLLSVKDVAQETGLSISMIYKLISTGKLKFIKIGDTYRFRQETVDEFLKEERNDRTSSTT